ncbi:hypothetical protein [Okeania sp. KiyG1]|nr:hypothetical protein [Okeania sp. KiyG1]
MVTYPKQALRLTGNQIRIPLGRRVKQWFGFDSFFMYAIKFNV